MLKNNHGHSPMPSISQETNLPQFHLYRESLTEPLKTTHRASHLHEKSQKKEKKPAPGPRIKEGHEIYIREVEEEAIRNPIKPKPRHKKGKSMDLEMIIECLNSNTEHPSREHPEKTKKVLINSTFIHDMRKRNANSEMKNYNHNPKTNRAEERGEVKRKKKKSIDLLHPNRKADKFIFQISAAITAPHLKKKTSKNSMQHSLTLSTKLHKHEYRSAELVQDRRCKSSLREKKAKQGELNMLANGLPLASKLNSLYSNTTSIYSSHNDLPIIAKRLNLRIPTEDASEELKEIRKYESLVLSTDKSIKAIRNARHQHLLKSLDSPYVEPENVKTEDIISSYLLKFEAESQPEIIKPTTLEQINEICQESKLDIKPSSASNSFIQRLDSASIDEHLGQSEQGESTKLNQIIAIIEKGGKGALQDGPDKEYIIKTIREILQNKKKAEGSEILSIEKYEAKEPKTKTFFDSNSINSSSLTNSMASEADISVLNLEILDKALREREQYLHNRLKKEIERIEEQDDTRDQEHEIERVTKWITHQIKEVRHTRTQLWNGFNVAKSLLKDELHEKSHEMMRCLSEKYVHTPAHVVRHKKESQPESKGEEQSPEVNYDQLNEAMIEQHSPKNSDSEEEASPIIRSPLTQHNPLQLQDLRFLTNNDFNQELQSDDESPKQGFSTPESLTLQLKKIEETSSDQIDKVLKRERLNCESPHSDSGSESYGAIIIEREDTFLFSSEKKETGGFLSLSIEDKQDICEFLFLDLCIEIADELPKEGKVLQALERFIRRMKEQSKRAKGFKTNATAIKEYLSGFINFLKTRPELIEEIHCTLDKPMGPSTLEILKYMHSYSEEADEDNESYVLTAKIFDAFEESYMRNIRLERYYEDEEKEGKRRLFIKNAIHIHNKAIYDAFNELLDKDRPFGIWGEPFSWKKVPKFSHSRDTRTKNQILLRRAQETIEFGNFMCGFMLQKEDCPLRDNPNISEAYIEQIRYDRLSHMMAKELEDAEQRMRFFDDEETELLVDMAQNIFNEIVGQVCADLAGLL